MAAQERVCPFCGEPPGVGVFCAACGRNLSAVQQLPTRAEWEQGGSAATAAAPAAPPAAGAPPAPAAAPADDRPLAERCAEATGAFLAAMHAAGDPGTVEMPITGKTGFFKTPKIAGWIVRPVERDEDAEEIDELKRYVPGLVLTPDGVFHRIDSEVKGWGQRDFPHFHDSADADQLDMPVEERLIDELAAVRREHGVE
jgi:hypothetical protein